MSSFTEATSFRPINEGPDAGLWQVVENFDWYLSSDLVGEKVTVLSGYLFDGASVPFILTAIFPRVHPKYMQAAALHDWLLTQERHRFSREEIDLMFYQALKVLNNPKWRSFAMYKAVHMYGRVSEGQRYFRKIDLSAK